MVTFILATRNKHKVEEIRTILGSEFSYRTLDDFPDAPKTVEDAGTFAGNATNKAVELAAWLAEFQLTPHSSLLTPPAFVLADDSGLEVDALNGAPGVHSARFAAMDTGVDGNAADADNNAKLLRLLKDAPAEQRAARFRCVLALTPVVPAHAETASPVCSADEREVQTEIFDGVCEGCIASAPSGRGGFGYDPLFVPDGYAESFAELGEEVKNRLSHRAKALLALKSRMTALGLLSGADAG